MSVLLFLHCVLSIYVCFVISSLCFVYLCLFCYFFIVFCLFMSVLLFLYCVLSFYVCFVISSLCFVFLHLFCYFFKGIYLYCVCESLVLSSYSCVSHMNTQYYPQLLEFTTGAFCGKTDSCVIFFFSPRPSSSCFSTPTHPTYNLPPPLPPPSALPTLNLSLTGSQIVLYFLEFRRGAH